MTDPDPDTKQLIERLRKHGVMPDELAALLPDDARDAFYHLTSMYSHRGDGIPTQFTYPKEARDAAVALAVAALQQPDERTVVQHIEGCEFSRAPIQLCNCPRSTRPDERDEEIARLKLDVELLRTALGEG
jgi:hypothetical protein